MDICNFILVEKHFPSNDFKRVEKFKFIERSANLVNIKSVIEKKEKTNE